MFGWIVGSGLGLMVLGGWRMAVQGKATQGTAQNDVREGMAKGDNLLSHEVPQTRESILLKQLERQLAGMEEKLDAVMAAVASGSNGIAGGGATAAVSGAAVKEREKPVSDQYQTQLDQIVRLSERGTAVEAIAKKMNMHKGEVQLLLNLSKKSS